MHDENDDVMDFSDAVEVFGVESLLLKSVGITIGSSTSHLMFSNLTVRRRDSRASRFEITEREVLYRSPIIFTPYVAGVNVDTEKLQAFIAQAYADAGMTPESVDTGAVIITGYAARKENARAIVSLFSRWAGKFVCATAGPNLETMMAAYGSGAVKRSRETGKTVMNIDIGGGTSKAAIIRDGIILETASLFVGSRVLARDKAGRLERIEESGALAAEECGLALKIGAALSDDDRKSAAEALVAALFELIGRKEPSPFTRRILETSLFTYQGKIDRVMFSGGVAEYIYDHERADFGDLGPFLGEKIRQRVSDPAFGIALQEPEERIRATVMGAAQYSLQVSGNTIFISRSGMLPQHNLQVIKVCVPGGKPAAEDVAGALRSALAKYDIDGRGAAGPVALSVHIPPEAAVGPDLLRSLTRGILSTWTGIFTDTRPLVLIFSMDIAHLVGSMLAQRSGQTRDILCVDGIDVGDLDYVDIGREIQSSRTVPVVVKNLIFAKGKPC